MFHPVDHLLERGWVGRIDGDLVVQLAAQTLQSFFTGGGTARDHAVFPLADVQLLAPVLHPPAVRVFADQGSFEFANPAAVVGPDAAVGSSPSLEVLPRLAAVVGADGAIGGFTACADWRNTRAAPPKDRDFALGIGPVVVTPEELDGYALEVIARVDGEERARGVLPAFDWGAALELAQDGTTLYPGDLLIGPSSGSANGLVDADVVELELPGVGTLRQSVGARA
jgi:Fumarylacetoacetate (FAA) hydrolase family